MTRTSAAHWPRRRSSLGFLFLLLFSTSLAALAVTLLLLPPAVFAAVYGGALYPALTALYAALTSWTHLPLGLAILPIACGIFLWRTLGPFRRIGRWRRVLRLLLLALLLLSVYLVTWGANYRRPDLLRLLGVAPRAATQAEIDAFGGELLRWVVTGAEDLDEVAPDEIEAQRSAGSEMAENSMLAAGILAAAHDLVGGAGPGSNGGTAVGNSTSNEVGTDVTGDPTRTDAGTDVTDYLAAGAGRASEDAADVARAEAALTAVADELEKLVLELGWPATVPSRVKLLPAGTLLSSGYAGILFPFTLEPQVDAGLSRVSRVAIGAHELAHAAGFADETEADMAALIAGLRAPHPLARYATALSLLSRSLGSLSQEQRTFVVANLPVRALRDLGEARERTARYLDSSLAARVTAVYNRLLKGQGVEAGVDAYGQAPVSGALLAAEGILPPAPLLVPDSGVDEGQGPTLAQYRQSGQLSARPSREPAILAMSRWPATLDKDIALEEMTQSLATLGR